MAGYRTEWLACVLSVLLRSTPTLAAVASRPFHAGEKFTIECFNHTTNRWGKGPKCAETGEELSFTYGQDNFFYCGLLIENKEHFKHLTALSRQEKNWNCRVPMSADRNFHLPFSIPIWGVVEAEHIHLDNHFNFIFHGDTGRVIGVAAYPVRDRFQYGKVGSVINFHGPVRWFHRHSFTGMSNVNTNTPQAATGSNWFIVAWCGLSAMITLIVSAFVYQWLLKPALQRKYLKKN